LPTKPGAHVRLTNSDGWLFIQIYRWRPSILQVLRIIGPATLRLRRFPREWHSQYAQQRERCQHRHASLTLQTKAAFSIIGRT
jgi:hypothetical protein